MLKPAIVTQLVTLTAVSGFLVSCASERTVTEEKVRKDAWGNKENYTIESDEDGNAVAKSDVRSSLEGRTSHLGGSSRDFGGQDYTKKSYRKTRWGGNTVFGHKAFGGNTDANRYKKEPWFAQKQSSSANRSANAAGKSYSVNPFRTRTANEQSNSRIESISDAATDTRQRVFKEPSIRDYWSTDQQGPSISDTNSRLGR